MQIVTDFFNKLTSEIKSKYFASVGYYRDNETLTTIHYKIELFNNGCLTYTNLIKELVTGCNDSETNIKAIVDKFIVF